MDTPQRCQGGLVWQSAGMFYMFNFKEGVAPHMHLSFFLQQEDKMRNPSMLYYIVSAQIPESVAHPLSMRTVPTHVHGPCGPGHGLTPAGLIICSNVLPKQFEPELSPPFWTPWLS